MCASSAAWQPIPGQTVTEQPVVIQNRDGRLEVFTVQRGKVFHAWEQRLGADWTSLQQLGSRSDLSAISVARNQDGRLEVFARGSLAIYHTWQQSEGGWYDWTRLGSIRLYGKPLAARRADGRLQVVLANVIPGSGSAFGDIYSIQQQSPGGGWTGWNKLPSDIPNTNGATLKASMIDIATTIDGSLELFALGNVTGGTHVWSCRQQSPGNSWSPWEQLVEPAFPPSYRGLTAAANADGRLEIFVTTSAGATIYHRWQQSPGGRWSEWAELDILPVRIFGPLYAGLNHDGRLEVFGQGFDDGAIWHIIQTAPGSSWTQWASLGRAPFLFGDRSWRNEMAVGIEADGRLDLFARCPSVVATLGDQLYHRSQVAWGNWG